MKRSNVVANEIGHDFVGRWAAGKPATDSDGIADGQEAIDQTTLDHRAGPIGGEGNRTFRCTVMARRANCAFGDTRSAAGSATAHRGLGRADEAEIMQDPMGVWIATGALGRVRL